jgi:uncharacterized iron-regulated protein
MKLISIIGAFLLTVSLQAQDLPAYRVFKGNGKKADYSDILREAKKADVVFFGELHDNPIAHWLELVLTGDLYAARKNELILAAEMFETDNQLLINEYFSDLIKESSFEKEVRLWKNYATDYKPLVSFARQHGLRFVASNIPRRYASVVASGGFEALEKLSPEALHYIAPLPVEYDPSLPCYKDMLSMDTSIGGGMDKKISENLPKAQAIKDATMAKSIADSRKDGQIVLHFNGSYHSDRHLGILWYLDRYDPGLKVMTISTVIQENIDNMEDEFRDQADFVIVIPSNMTRTYK